jgi:predicted nucleic acid-binding protein
MSEAFLDTSFAIALAAPADLLHAKAIELADRCEDEGWRLVTTHAVLPEIGDAFPKQPLRPIGVGLLEQLALDTRIEVVPLSEDLYRRAFELCHDRPDKNWGLTDCISFIDMSDRGIVDALTADSHFRQAGFRPLLHEA